MKPSTTAPGMVTEITAPGMVTDALVGNAGFGEPNPVSVTTAGMSGVPTGANEVGLHISTTGDDVPAPEGAALTASNPRVKPPVPSASVAMPASTRLNLALMFPPL